MDLGGFETVPSRGRGCDMDTPTSTIGRLVTAVHTAFLWIFVCINALWFGYR